MSVKRESNSNVWETEDGHSKASATSITKIESPCLNPNPNLEYHPLSGFKIQGACTKTELEILPKPETTSLPTDPSNKSEVLLISDLVGTMDQKKLLAKVKEEITTNFNLSSVSSEVLYPTISTPASVRIEINRLSPVVVLEPFPYPTTCLEMISGDKSSTQVVDHAKNRRRNIMRRSGSPTVVRRPKFSIGKQTKKCVTKHSVRHIRSDKNKLLRCEQCDKSFSLKSNLKRHMIIHAGDRHHTCGQCDKSFNLKKNLQDHMKIHTREKLNTCWHCGKSFTRKSSLKMHMTAHTGKKQYRCWRCGKSFSLTISLTTHMAIHTNEKQYICGQCDKAFNHKSYLKMHMIIHTGEKMHTCLLCGKSFNRKCNFKRHIIIHTGEKQYNCGQCGKAFNEKSSLKRHMTIHTGEKEYKCGQCGKAFTQKNSLKRHVVVHTREKL